VPTDSAVTPTNARRQPISDTEAVIAITKEAELQKDLLDFKVLGQLSDTALEIIEPCDFLEILVDLFTTLPDSFISVVAQMLGKAKEVCKPLPLFCSYTSQVLLRQMCNIFADFAVEMVCPLLSGVNVTHSTLENLSCVLPLLFRHFKSNIVFSLSFPQSRPCYKDISSFFKGIN
jgi:hypothetical protein